MCIFVQSYGFLVLGAFFYYLLFASPLFCTKWSKFLYKLACHLSEVPDASSSTISMHKNWTEVGFFYMHGSCIVVQNWNLIFDYLGSIICITLLQVDWNCHKNKIWKRLGNVVCSRSFWIYIWTVLGSKLVLKGLKNYSKYPASGLISVTVVCGYIIPSFILLNSRFERAFSRTFQGSWDLEGSVKQKSIKLS